MLTVSTVFTSLVALHAFLASTGQGQVEANVLRRGTGGHSGRHSNVIRGLLNDGSFQRRQDSCPVGYFACSDGTGCCPTGQTCDTLPDGSPTCCCTTGGNCPSGSLPCSNDVNVCCPDGDVCASDGTCAPAGSSGGGGGGGGGTGGSGGGNGGGGGGTGGTATESTGLPHSTVTALPSSTPALGGGLGGSSSALGGGLGGDTSSAFGGGLGGTTTAFGPSTPVVTVTPTLGSTGSSGTNNKNGEAGLRAGTGVVMMGSVIVASGLALLIL